MTVARILCLASMIMLTVTIITGYRSVGHGMGAALFMNLFYVLTLGVHVVLGIPILVIALRSRRHLANSWIYLYYLVVFGVSLHFFAGVNDWGGWIQRQAHDIRHPNEAEFATMMSKSSYDHERAKELIAAGVDVNLANPKGLYPLFMATTRGDVEMVQLLVDAGADVNGLGKQPLLFVVRARWHAGTFHKKKFDSLLEIGRILIKAGADANITDSNGKPLLLMVLEGGRSAEPMLRDLIEAGVNVNARFSGKNALHASGISAEAVRMLIAAGANMKLRDINGETPLIAAAKNGNLEVIKALLDAGADHTQKDAKGLTALDWAKQNGHDEVIVALDK